MTKGMVNMSNRQQPHQDENISPRHQLVFNERRTNSHTTGQAAVAPKTSLYIGTSKELPKYTQHETKLKVKTEKDIQRPEIPDLGQAQKLLLV